MTFTQNNISALFHSGNSGKQKEIYSDIKQNNGFLGLEVQEIYFKEEGGYILG
jgi:hypothetical protein